MTNDKVIKKLEHYRYCLNFQYGWYGKDDDEALDMAITALEQKSILDKIRAEIMDTGAYEQEVHGKTEFLEGINYCLDILDKYKTESK